MPTTRPGGGTPGTASSTAPASSPSLTPVSKQRVEYLAVSRNCSGLTLLMLLQVLAPANMLEMGGLRRSGAPDLIK